MLVISSQIQKKMISELVTEAPVLVTGARGFVAGHIILQLLARGYKVRATLRGITNKHGKEVFPEESTYKYLKEFPNADKNLELVLADLVDPWSSLVLEENDSDVSEEDAVADIQGSLSESNHSHAGSVGSKEGTPFARAWSNAFAGVEYVIHVASPYIGTLHYMYWQSWTPFKFIKCNQNI